MNESDLNYTIWEDTATIDTNLGEVYDTLPRLRRGFYGRLLSIPPELQTILFKTPTDVNEYSPPFILTAPAFTSLFEFIAYKFPYMNLNATDFDTPDTPTVIHIEEDELYDIEGSIHIDKDNRTEPMIRVMHRSSEIADRLSNAVESWLHSILQSKVKQTFHTLKSLQNATRINTPSNWYYGPPAVPPEFLLNTTATALSGLKGPLSSQIVRLQEKISRPYTANGVGGNRKTKRTKRIKSKRRVR